MADLKVKVNTPVNFNDTSINATEYAWTFGDGIVSTEKNPTHPYSTIGLYDVTHSAINECGTSTCTPKTVEVTADQPPSSGSNALLYVSAAVLGFMMFIKK